MAEYHNWFSFILPLNSDVERTWATELVDAVRSWDEHTPAGWLDEVLGSAFGYVGVEVSVESNGLWVRSGDSGDVNQAISLTQHYLATHRPTESVGIEWANICTAPRTDGFGGGAARITATDVHSISTATWLGQQGGVVTVTYTAPVYVDVDLDTGQVVSVTVVDDRIERDTELGIRDRVWDAIDDAAICARALAVVDEDEWPSWEFGGH